MAEEIRFKLVLSYWRVLADSRPPVSAATEIKIYGPAQLVKAALQEIEAAINRAVEQAGKGER